VTDAVQIQMAGYQRLRYPDQPLRYMRLMTTLVPKIRAIEPETVEKLFFKNLPDNVSIDQLVWKMFSGETYQK